MPSCERCWQMANGDPEKYNQFLGVNECTKEEQAGGQDAGDCPSCGRKTVHLYARYCIVCGFKPEGRCKV